MSTPTHAPTTVTVDWIDALRFAGTTPKGATITMDSAGNAGPSPVDVLLMSGAACSGMDVVSILEKMQVTLAHCRIEVSGTRAEEHPRRLLAITLRFRIKGEGLTEAKVERAVALSVEKYCSVMRSLDPGIAVVTEIVIES
jgi:putative redox protein